MAIIKSYVPNIYENINENALTDKIKKVSNKAKEGIDDWWGKITHFDSALESMRDKEVGAAEEFINWVFEYLKCPIVPGDENKLPNGVLGKLRRDYKHNNMIIKTIYNEAYNPSAIKSSKTIEGIEVMFYNFNAIITPTDFILAEPSWSKEEDMYDFFDQMPLIIQKGNIKDKIDTINNQTDTFNLFLSRYAEDDELEWSSSARGTFGVFALIATILNHIAYYYTEGENASLVFARRALQDEVIKGGEINGKPCVFKNRGRVYDETTDTELFDPLEGARTRMWKFLCNYKAAWNKYIRPAAEKTNKFYEEYNKYNKGEERFIQLDRVTDEKPYGANDKTTGETSLWDKPMFRRKYQNLAQQEEEENQNIQDSIDLSRYDVDDMLESFIPDFRKF